MKNKLRIFSIVILMALVTGCGSTRMAVKPEVASRIHSIALIRVGEPEAYVAQDFGNPGMMLGAVGGAVAGASSANAEKSVTQIVTDRDYAAGRDLTQLLESRLRDMGYEVQVVSVERKDKDKLLEDYRGVETGGADAILDVVIESIGYATEHPMFSPHWRPASQIRVALVDSRSGEKLYAEKFMYGYHNPFMSGTDLDAPATHHFKNKDALFADGKKLVAGIQDSVRAVTVEIGNSLK